MEEFVLLQVFDTLNVLSVHLNGYLVGGPPLVPGLSREIYRTEVTTWVMITALQAEAGPTDV